MGARSVPVSAGGSGWLPRSPASVCSTGSPTLRWTTSAPSELIDAAARLTRKLLKAGYTFKDLKPSNIIIDGAGVMHLIDVGSAKPSTRKKQVARMLAVMDRVLKRNDIQQALCERYRRSVLGP